VVVAKFAEGQWSHNYLAIAQSCRQNWAEVIPFFAFPDGVCRIIYTTDELDKRSFSGVLLLLGAGDP
jgi:putative transposase